MGYSYLDVDYENDGFLYDVAQHVNTLGLSWRFWDLWMKNEYHPFQKHTVKQWSIAEAVVLSINNTTPVISILRGSCIINHGPPRPAQVVVQVAKTGPAHDEMD